MRSRLIGGNVINIKKYSLLLGWLICFLGAVFYCYSYLLRIEPSVMLPYLMHTFSISAGTLGVVIALYYFAYTPMQLVVGVLTDRYGARTIMSIAIIACAGGSFLFSSNSHALYIMGISRLLIGFGSAFAFVGVLKLAAEWLPKRHFAMFTGYAVSLGMLGAIIGINLLTASVHSIGWKPTLYIGTTIGIVLTPLMMLIVRDTPKWRSEHAGVKTSYRKVFGGIYQIISNSQMWLTGIISGILYLSLSAFAELWGISFLQTVYKITPHQAALACSMVFGGWLIGAPFSGWLSDKINTRKLPIIVGSIITTISVTIIILKPLNLSFPELCVLLLIFGIASCTHVICFAMSRENNPTHVAATAISFTNLLTMLGGVICQPLIGKLLDYFWDGKMQYGVHHYSATAYQLALAIIPILMLLGTILTFFLRETYVSEVEDEFDID